MHLTQNEILLYLENKTSRDEHEKVEVHLSNCKDCVSALSDTYKLLHDIDDIEDVPLKSETLEKAKKIVRHREYSFERKKGRIKLVFGTAVLTIVFISAIVFYMGNEEVINDPEAKYRNKTGFNKRTVDQQVYFPPDNFIITSESFSLKWMKSANAVEYRLNIFDDRGEKLLDVSTSDSAIIPGDFIKMIPGKEYLWNLETILPDGRKLKSSVFSFRYSPQ